MGVRGENTTLTGGIAVGFGLPFGIAGEYIKASSMKWACADPVGSVADEEEPVEDAGWDDGARVARESGTIQRRKRHAGHSAPRAKDAHIPILLGLGKGAETMHLRSRCALKYAKAHWLA